VNVWAAEGAGGNGVAMFDAPYSTYTGIQGNIIANSDNLFRIYPNPCNGKFQVEFRSKNQDDCKVEITNSLGTKVFSFFSSVKATKNIDISNYPKGIYLIKLHNQDRTYINKMVCK
jgi:hypothetical protein